MYGRNSFGGAHGDARRVFSQENDGSILGIASVAFGRTSASCVSPPHLMSAYYPSLSPGPCWFPGRGMDPGLWL